MYNISDGGHFAISNESELFFLNVCKSQILVGHGKLERSMIKVMQQTCKYQSTSRGQQNKNNSIDDGLCVNPWADHFLAHFTS